MSVIGIEYTMTHTCLRYTQDYFTQDLGRLIKPTDMEKNCHIFRNSIFKTETVPSNNVLYIMWIFFIC